VEKEQRKGGEEKNGPWPVLHLPAAVSCRCHDKSAVLGLYWEMDMDVAPPNLYPNARRGWSLGLDPRPVTIYADYGSPDASQR